MPNVIKQIVNGDGDAQTIKMVVRDNERGPQGEQGEPGIAATIAAGNAYGLDYGEQPRVMNSGTSSAAVFDFYIPEGKNGTSATIQVGETTTLPAGCPAKVVNVGDENNAIFNFDIPKGDTGPAGPQGVPGIPGPQGIPGKDGAIQYTAGSGIEITEGNVINATGSAQAVWGNIDGTLSDQTDLQNALNAKQNTLTAGANITISNGTISATDTTYTAGNAITIDSANNNQINAAIDPANFFTAGENTLVSGSSITVSNSANLPIKDVQINGDTFQQTYSGKNLFNKDSLNVVISSNCNIVSTQSGVRAISTRTTTSTTSNYDFAFARMFELTPYVGTTISFSAGGIVPSYPGNGRIGIATCDADGSNSSLKFFLEGSDLDHSYTVASNDSGKYIALVFYAINGVASPAGTYVDYNNIQVEFSSTATAYEPYVGGIAAPNPDYPQDIDVVTGEQTINIAGKNLFNVPDGTSTNLGMTWVFSNNTAIVSGTPTNFYSYGGAREDFGIPLSAGTFTLSIAEPISYRTILSIVDTNGSEHQYSIPIGDTKVTFSTNYIAQSFRVGIRDLTSGTPANITISNIQLELGSTATAFEPYQSQTYEINLGKNLLGLQDVVSTTTSGVTYSVTNGVLKISGTASASGRIAIPLVSNITLNSGNYYTMSAVTSGTVSGSIGFQLRNIDNTANVLDALDTALPYSTNSVSGTAGYFALYIASGRSFTDYEVQVQFETGSTSSPYEAYRDPIELCKIGDYQDYIYDNGGDWYVHKVVANSKLGSLEWVWNGTTVSGKYRMSSNSLRGIILPPSSNAEVGKVVCSHYVPKRADSGDGGTYGANEGVSVNQSGSVVIYDPAYNTQTSSPAYTEWLTNNNVVLYYVLLAPTDTKITDSTLISQLNALKSAQTYDGVTYITVNSVSPNLPAILGVTAFNKSLAGTLEALTENSFTTTDQAKLANIDSTMSTITMTNVDPGEGSALAANNFIAVYGSNQMDYSTSETNTGLKWVDGNTIYKKTVYVSSLPNNVANVPTAHGISNLAQLVNVEAIAATSSGTMYALPYANSNTSLIITYNVDNTNIYISTGSDRSSASAYFTLYYTKSS